MQGLMLSVGLHLALLALVHPMPSTDTGTTLVINARLAPQPPQQPPPMEEEATPPDVIQDEQQNPPEPLPPLPAETLPVPRPAPVQQPETPLPAQEPMPAQKSETSAQVEQATPAAQPGPAIKEPPVETPALTLPSPVDVTWYLARQVDKHPRAIGSITPKYPESARQQGKEGSLKLMVKIDDQGQVRDVEVVEAHPPGMFDEAAMEAFRNARFQPAMKDGRPVRYEAYMRVEFKLE